MAEKSEVLRRNCGRYIDALEVGGAEPLVIEALRTLVRSHASTAETASRLWFDNQALRADITKHQATIKSLKRWLETGEEEQ